MMQELKLDRAGVAVGPRRLVCEHSGMTPAFDPGTGSAFACLIGNAARTQSATQKAGLFRSPASLLRKP